MKVFPAGLDTLLATTQFVHADLYDFILQDGTVLYYTTADTDVLYNGNVYTSKGPFFEEISSGKSRWHCKAGMDMDTWEIVVAPAATDPITGVNYPATIYSHPWMVSVRVGALDGAEVDVHRAYWAAWPTRPFSVTSAVTATFDPAFKYVNATLSNGNLTAANTDNNNNTTSTRSTVSKTSGKFFCSFTVNAMSGVDQVGVGACNSSQTTGTSLAAGVNAAGYFSDSGVYQNGTPTFIQAFAVGNIIDMALDIDNLKIWFRTNGGNWNNNGAANPATNTGGIALGFSGTLFAAVECRNGQVTANFGATAYTYAAPAGFGNFTTPSVVSTPYLIPTYVLSQLFSGYVADVQCGSIKATIKLESWMGILQRQMPRHVFTTGCRWTLFDAGCTLNQASFLVTGTVAAVTDTANFTLSAGVALNYFALGQIQFTSGANTPFSRGIVSDSGPSTKLIKVRMPFPYQIQIGDAYKIYPGCDKQSSTCNNKFSNLLNFGGFPFVPPPETAI